MKGKRKEINVKQTQTVQGVSALGSLAVACGLFISTPAPLRADDTNARIGQGSDNAYDEEGASDRDDEGRKSSVHRRAPAARGARDFDPRVYEARGRELQGEYYEITTMANAPSWSSRNSDATSSGKIEAESNSHSAWLWAGAGLAGIAGAALGYFLLEKPDASQPQNVEIALTDKP
jgi:hypothetical protein